MLGMAKSRHSLDILEKNTRSHIFSNEVGLEVLGRSSEGEIN
jgi:hypothetical protein